MIKKSVISLISYDAALLPESIKSYYPYVDEILLGLDEARISWSKNSFKFDEVALYKTLKNIDVNNKIKIIEGDFHKSDVALENDNYERNYLKEKCSYDWVFSFDADEVLINPKPFFYEYCPLIEPYKDKVDLVFTWFLPYKEFENDYLVIANEQGRWFAGDTQSFATAKKNTYKYCRWTDNQRLTPTPLAIMHWSFCRPEGALDQKLNNFGHSDKSKNDPFFHNWKQVTLDNYQMLRNFKTSGFGQNQWSQLIKVPKAHFWEIAQQQAKGIY